MVQTSRWMLGAVLLAAMATTLCAAHKEVIKLEQAKADPDFAVQGEYLGRGGLFGEAEGKVGAQVIARGDGQFEVVVQAGGLPGEGWRRGDPVLRAEAKRDGEAVVVRGEGVEGVLVDGKLNLVGPKGDRKAKLERVERKSPTLGAKPPKDAVVLFDGTGLEYFPDGKMTDENTLLSGTVSKAEFNSYELHLEFRLTWMPTARGQGRSNSGVYIHHCYEVQVLDSFGLEGRDNECGGLYKIKAPDVNMCLPPMVWQTYDVDFTAPKFNEQSERVAKAQMTVRHNGQVIHDDLVLPHDTPGGKPEGPGPRALMLQGHGCHVQYRNIWLKKKD